MKMNELKEIAKGLGIKFNPIGLRKDDLIKLIEEAQAPAEKKVVSLADVEIQKILEAIETKSGKIRFLLEQGLARTEIAKIVGVRYQMVRNVEKKMS